MAFGASLEYNPLGHSSSLAPDVVCSSDTRSDPDAPMEKSLAPPAIMHVQIADQICARLLVLSFQRRPTKRWNRNRSKWNSLPVSKTFQMDMRNKA
jgi:hypothetical protein